nr:hypothetical protein [Tanacetum cinerariifolium]
MVFIAQIEKVLSDSEASSLSFDEKISEVSYYLSESKIESASENVIENHIDFQKDYDKSDVDHNDSEEKDHLVDKLIRKINKKIVKCQKHIEKANQQSKNFENQNKYLQDKYDVLKNQATTFEMNNKELNEQLKELIEKNNDLLAQMKVLKDQLQVKHVVIDTHLECQEKYAKFEAERYEYMIRYSAYFDNDKQHRKQIADQEVLYDKMSVQLVDLDKHFVMALPLSPNHAVDFPKIEPAQPETRRERTRRRRTRRKGTRGRDGMDMDIKGDSDDAMDGPELIIPYEAMSLPYPPPPELDTSSDSEPKDALATTAMSLPYPPPPELDTSSDSEPKDALATTVGTITQLPSTRRNTVVGLCIRWLLWTSVFKNWNKMRLEKRNERLKKRLISAEENDTLVRIDRDRAERDLYHLRVWAYRFYEEMIRSGAVEERPSEAVDVLATFGETHDLFLYQHI